MKFVKEEEENREDYIFQKNEKTKFGAKFIIITLVLLAVAVIASGLYLEWF